METPKEAVIRHKRRNHSPQTTSNSDICAPSLKQVFVHDWWLTKSDSDSYGKRLLGIGGFASKERQGIRSFSSGPIVKRHDAVTLRTMDGVVVLVHGHLNRHRTLENGFSHEVCEHFQIGFPYYWEEFSVISVGEETFSDPYKTSSPRDHGTNMPNVNLFDDILRKSYADVCPTKEDTPMTTPEQKIRDVGVVEGVARTGPLTRSRARLLQTRRGS